MRSQSMTVTEWGLLRYGVCPEFFDVTEDLVFYLAVVRVLTTVRCEKYCNHHSLLDSARVLNKCSKMHSKCNTSDV